jgi:hypothetical protein
VIYTNKKLSVKNIDEQIFEDQVGIVLVQGKVTAFGIIVLTRNFIKLSRNRHRERFRFAIPVCVRAGAALTCF